MNNQSIPTYDLDLRLGAKERLAQVIQAEAETARGVLAEIRAEFKELPKCVSDAFGVWYGHHGGLYKDELLEWSKGVDISFGELVMANCSYELSHLAHKWSVAGLLKRIPFGCTAGVIEAPALGMVHLRNLDWPIRSMGAATRIFRYRGQSHESVAVGFPAYVGVLSGMVPGGYSASINWAPPSSMPDSHWGPAFLLRDVLETCPTYQQAVARLRSERLSTSVFFTVCGVLPGEGCIIERTAKRHALRPLVEGAVVQTNHHMADEFLNLGKFDADDDLRLLIQNSVERQGFMLRQLHRARREGLDLRRLLDCLSLPPVCNGETVQRIAFHPARGEMLVECLDGDQDREPCWRRSFWQSGSIQPNEPTTKGRES